MDDDWGDWSAPPPVAAAAAAAQPAQQRAQPVQNASVGRQPLDPALFAQEDEFGGFEAAPVTLPPERADQQHHATQQQREGQAELVKGDLAWLLDGRSGAWLHARVVSVDRTVHPPSYGVELPDGSYRETEAHRLLPRQPGAAPPPAANGHHAPGSWAAAAASPFDQPAGGPAKAAAAVAAPPPAAVAAAAAGPAAAAAAEDEEDDFGEWAAAGALPLPAAQAAAPRPAAAAAAPGSPRREGAMVHAVPASAHGSPQRLPTRSSAPPSPVLDRFRLFLHAAAPQVSEQLELEEAAEEQRSAVEQQRHQAYDSLQQLAASHLPPSPRLSAAAAAGVPPAAPAAAPAAAAVLPSAANGWEEDDFGSFEAAEPTQLTQQQPQPMATLPHKPAQQPQALQQQPQSPQQQPQQPAGAATPRGVQRDAPLPLDLFGEEPIENGAANGNEPAMQPAAAAAPAALAPIAAAVAAAAVGAAATAASPVPAAAGTAGTAGGGDGWDDEFADFVSSPPAAAAEAAATTAGKHPAAAAAVEQQPAAAAEQATELGGTEQHVAEQPPAGHEQAPAAVEPEFPPLPVGGSLGTPIMAAGAAAAAADCSDASAAAAAAGAGPTEQPTSPEWGASAAAAPAPPPPLPVPHQQPVSPSSVGSAGSRQSALMAALHPVSSTASSARSSFEQPRAAVAAAPAQQWGSRPLAVPLAAAALAAAGAAAGLAAAGATPAPAAAGVWPVVGQELVQEYAVAWARLLEATAAQLQTSAALWAEAGSHGCWQEVQQLPAAQQHLAACAQLYHASAIVRLAAQQLGLFSLVGELQEAWAQVEAAWLSTASLISDSAADGDGAEPAEQQQQPAFRDAALGAWEAACGPGAGSPAAVQGMLQSAAAQLGAMSLDDFPRMLAWSQGLCGLTLLPLSLFEGALPVANWEALAGRPCLVLLANLWLHRVSSQAPQLD